MKKVCVLLLLHVLVFGTASYGAVSEDMYVRKDVYEAHQQSINSKLDMLLEQMRVQREEQKEQINELRGEMKEFREELKAQRKDINELARVVSVLSTRVDGLDARMGDLRNGLEGRIGDLRNDIYLGLVILGIVVGLPAVQKALQKREERKAMNHTLQMPFTLDDVRRLIEENNAKVLGKPQV